MGMQYNNPGTTPSTMGTQYSTQYYYKKALIDAKKEMYFSPLADVLNTLVKRLSSTCMYLYLMNVTSMTKVLMLQVYHMQTVTYMVVLRT